MKSIFMSTTKRLPNSEHKTYSKRVRILVCKKFGLLNHSFIVFKKYLIKHFAL